MILDTSALIAILRMEPEAEHFAALIEQADEVGISAASVLEASLVVGHAGQADLDRLLATINPTRHVVDEVQLTIARSAALRYGRGSGSPARLNYGDCFSYALAMASGRPLLFKGDDFVHTDVAVAG